MTEIEAKIERGERLTQADGERLFATRDIHTLGELANRVRERLHGDAAFYNINRHINYSNYCVLRCRFCSFYRPFPSAAARRTEAPDDQAGRDGYELNVDEVVAQAKQAYDRFRELGDADSLQSAVAVLRNLGEALGELGDERLSAIKEGIRMLEGGSSKEL